MGDPEVDFSEERMRILEMIEQGRISADEGLGLIQALNAAADRVDDRSQQAQPQDSTFVMPSAVGEIPNYSKPSPEEYLPDPSAADPDQPEVILESSSSDFVSDQAARKWKRWWIIPLFIGLGNCPLWRIVHVPGSAVFWNRFLVFMRIDPIHDWPHTHCPFGAEPQDALAAPENSTASRRNARADQFQLSAAG